METSEFALSQGVNDEELLDLVKSIQKGEELDVCILSLRDKLKGLIKRIKESKNNSAAIGDEEAFDICMMPIYEAAMNYDFAYKIRFTTYAFYYIQSALYFEIDERNGVIAPDRIKRLLPKVLQFINEYTNENDGEAPLNEEIQEALSSEDINVSLEDIESCRNMYFYRLPAQIEGDEGEECSIFETIEGSPTDSGLGKSLSDILEIAEVSEREKRIFLLKEEKGMTIKEIAYAEVVSPSVIARIINRVKAKIWRKKKELGRG